MLISRKTVVDQVGDLLDIAVCQVTPNRELCQTSMLEQPCKDFRTQNLVSRSFIAIKRKFFQIRYFTFRQYHRTDADDPW
ncbi:hypothetical protein KCU83_g612, partial [Aureobasidium melanogenum]